MILQDDAIAIALCVAQVEYETNNVELINSEFIQKDNQWLITLCVWEWFNCVWRVWECDDGKVRYAFLKELKKKQ